MEKRKPHHDLTGFKTEFVTERALRLSIVAERSMSALGFTRADVVVMVQGMTRAMFLKSMTTYEDHTVWQDVYHVPFQGLVLYVKLMVDEKGRLIISLKEK
jgi:motility quorum-sensing regulator/GCU-specific mRNA interferase toxin